MNLAYRLILASKSPRRKQLLEEVGLKFSIETYPIEESFDESMDAYEVAEFLAQEKAAAFRALASDELVITSDTVVINEGKVLVKPNNPEEAFDMLSALSNKSHHVVSGVCLKTLNKEVSFSAKTEVHFDSLSPIEIKHYIDRYKPFDKAGAYGIQEWIGMMGIKSINGDYYNVVGLPVNRLYQVLKSEFSQ